MDYFDYYLLHSLTAESYETAGRLDTFAFLSRKKAEGKIRHLGFSFHLLLPPGRILRLEVEQGHLVGQGKAIPRVALHQGPADHVLALPP